MVLFRKSVNGEIEIYMYIIDFVDTCSLSASKDGVKKFVVNSNAISFTESFFNVKTGTFTDLQWRNIKIN